MCTICAEEVTENGTTLECGHTFHVHCVLEWFRQHQSTCPNCRSDGQMARWTRTTSAQRVAKLKRRKDLPVAVRKHIARYTALAAKRKKMNQEYRDFWKQHRSVLRMDRSLQVKRDRCHRMYHSLQWQLAQVAAPGVPMLMPFEREDTASEVSGSSSEEEE